MDQNIKEKWVAALRSGKYKQGTGRLLRIKDGERYYCCLGLLMEVVGEVYPNTVSWTRYQPEPDGVQICTYKDQTMVAGLSAILLDDIGLAGRDGFVTLIDKKAPFNPMTSLVNMNDTQGLPFDKIADVIDECL